MRADPGTPPALDLDLTADIVRRAGLECTISGTGPHRHLRARRPHPDALTATHSPPQAHDGDSDTVADAEGWVRSGGAGSGRRVRRPDARRVAATVIAHTLLPHRDRDRPLTHAEARACGLAEDLCWR
jgi:hypothetical protein